MSAEDAEKVLATAIDWGRFAELFEYDYNSGVLMLETLYYPDEVRTADLPATPDVMVSQPELTMALSLVEMLQEPFDPKKYHDQYRVALLEMIEAKRNGEEVVATPEAPAPRTVDLMAALKASLEAAKKGKAGAEPTPITSAPAQGKDEPEESEELAVALNVLLSDLLPVRLVSHHLRLLGVLGRYEHADCLVLVDCDRSE